MQLTQSIWTDGNGWQGQGLVRNPGVQWVLAFGGRGTLQDPKHLRTLKETYPNAILLGCSTAGEIHSTHVLDESLVITAVELEHTQICQATVTLDQAGGDSHHVGRLLSEKLPIEGLRHVFVLSDGLSVNGSELVEGLSAFLPSDVSISGGLSGDASLFEETVVLSESGVLRGQVSVVGLYGTRIRIGSASLGGWDPFGPERLITRSEGNVLFELDGKPALELYKHYLGEHAKGLPATGFCFPMNIREEGSDIEITRTILAVDEEEGSLTFAGDVPEGHLGRLMKANFERLVDGAADAARVSHDCMGDLPVDLAILISCVGRKMVLKPKSGGRKSKPSGM